MHYLEEIVIDFKIFMIALYFQKPTYPTIDTQWENSKAVKKYLVDKNVDQVNSGEHPTMTSTTLIKRYVF